MNLYYVNQLIADVLAEHVDFDGVITPEGEKLLKELEISREDVVDSLIKEYKNKQVVIDGIAVEMTRLKLRKLQLESNQGSILKTVLPYLEEGKKVETSEYLLKWTTSSKLAGMESFDAELCYADDGSDLHDFVVKKTTEPTYAFDLMAIKKELKKTESKVIPMEIYVNSTKNLKIT